MNHRGMRLNNYRHSTFFRENLVSYCLGKKLSKNIKSRNNGHLREGTSESKTKPEPALILQLGLISTFVTIHFSEIITLILTAVRRSVSIEKLLRLQAL